MKIPTATYRLQFNPSFGFREAIEIVDYLKELGISHVYASPIFEARKGSVHGYDVTDPGRLNLELGSPEDFDALLDRLENANMGWVQDIVPNHMAFDFENPALRDLLEYGPVSPCRDFFDIDWAHESPTLKGKLSAPFLGDHYEKCLSEGNIRLGYGEDGFFVDCSGFKLPLAIKSYPVLLKRAGDELVGKISKAATVFIRFTRLSDRFAELARKGPGTEPDGLSSGLKAELWKLCAENSEISAALDRTLRLYNGVPGDKESFSFLHRLLGSQFFRLRFWKTAGEEINYRRFFDINHLIALRQDREDVFQWSHRLVLALVREGKIDGLRIDHADGLADPAGYLERLANAAKGVWLIVEKILEHGESIPESWPVQGSTGYEFSSRVESLFVRGENEKAMKSILYRRMPGGESFGQILADAKRQVLSSHFNGELDNLVRAMLSLATVLKSGADITRRQLKEALTEILIHFPVYRTYMAQGNISREDKTRVCRVLDQGALRRPDLSHEFEFLGEVLFKIRETPSERVKDFETLRTRAVTLFERLTAPLAAKGFEDTALYRYPLLLSLNEVGGAPDRFGGTRRSFHRFMAERAVKQPHSMNGSSTHDSKRGEDVRVRISVLSEIPDRWEKAVSRWQALNRHKKTLLNDVPVPDDAEEYFLYQTLVGTWPVVEGPGPRYVERLEKHMVKALREAKIHSSWRTPDRVYEKAVLSFVRRVLDDSDPGDLFLKEFVPFCRDAAYYGFINTLAQTLIKITAPGVPDFYQGAESMNLSLVDPDNRRPVDYGMRKKLLRMIRETGAGECIGPFPEKSNLMKHADRLKLFVVMQGLRVRWRHLRLFSDGSFVSLETSGGLSRHVIAFARRHENKWSVTATPRFLAGLVSSREAAPGAETWGDTTAALPPDAPKRWKNEITGRILTAKGRLFMGEVFESFPIALLTGVSEK